MSEHIDSTDFMENRLAGLEASGQFLVMITSPQILRSLLCMPLIQASMVQLSTWKTSYQLNAYNLDCIDSNSLHIGCMLCTMLQCAALSMASFVALAPASGLAASHRLPQYARRRMLKSERHRGVSTLGMRCYPRKEINGTKLAIKDPTRYSTK